ncbi:regulatory protein MarR (plasmid) [Gemmatirosa kalamazoonensis]|uniref:Regulatory protein MarR n=1 Tax=Gemmatirosa kalamazoonensis TaxID=861299 RepID=W0RSF4_9BACT|nr:MarR family transcriptional regulator [Gemmatirosa kalamazoonensis]AHG92523.1 regulatory protein MarR [Gemmatirosa kalamazoonensis]
MATRRARSHPVLPPADDTAVAVADRLHSAAIHLLRSLRREDVRTGLTAPRLSALSVVVFGGPRTLGELAAAEQVRPPTMTRLVAALEAQGLVARDPDPTDGRVVRVRATAKGQRLLAAGRARRVATLAAQVDALTPEERETLARAADLVEAMLRAPTND